METPIAVTLTFENNAIVEGTLTNVSMTGLLVKSGEQIGDGEDCVVLIVVDDVTTIEMKAKTVRVDPDSIGLSVTGISGVGYEALHELLLENAKDPDAVRNEIFSLDHLTPDIY